MYSVEVTIKKELTFDDLDSILCGALEGGSNYWLESLTTPDNTIKELADQTWKEEWDKGNYHKKATHYLTHGLTITVTPDEPFEKENGEEIKSYGLNLQNLLDGYKLYCEKVTHGKLFPSIKDNLEIDQMDAGDYDMIFQLALFGEVVYG